MRRRTLAFALSLLPIAGTTASPVAAAQRASFGGSMPARPGPTLDRTSALLLVGFGAAAAVSRSFEDSDRTAQLLDGNPFDVAIDVADRYGEGSTIALSAIGLYTLGRATGHAAPEKLAKDLSAALVAAWSVTWALKVSIDAKRPDGGPYSFPSGHTATAFTAAPILHRHLGPAAGYGGYGLASLTALARMEDRRHYLADVLVGAAIGIVAGRAVTWDGAIRWMAPDGGAGIGVTFGF